MGEEVGPCHTKRRHFIPVKSARQKRLEWQSSKLAPFGTKHELILSLRGCNVKVHCLNHRPGAIADVVNSLAKRCSVVVVPVKALTNLLATATANDTATQPDNF